METDREAWPRCTVPQVTVPEGRSGPWVVERQEAKERDAFLFNLRELAQGTRRFVETGWHTRLFRERRDGGGEEGGPSRVVFMSDTLAERRDHEPFLAIAGGHVLVAGLGLGVVLGPLLENPWVATITVVENSPDVLKLVGDHYLAHPHNWNPHGRPRLQLVEADAYRWRPPRGVGFDCAWLDIWPHMGAGVILDQLRLRRHVSRFCRGPILVWAWMENHAAVDRDPRLELRGRRNLRHRLAAERMGYHLAPLLVGHGPGLPMEQQLAAVLEQHGGDIEHETEGPATPGEPRARRAG